MNNEIRWFARLGLDRKLFSREQGRALYAALGESATLLDFAQKILDEGICTNVDALETAAGLAQQKAEQGPPPDDDPFAEPASGTDRPEKPAADGAPRFAFAEVGRLPDDGLRERLTALLMDCTRHGASDLHLSAGARPFIRRHRAHQFIADHVLTADESLRLNTALLTPEQKQAYLETKDFDCALALGDTSRYRVNLMFHKNGSAGCYRMVPNQARTLADLGFRNAETITKLLTYHNGLILVTGPVGAGKTTTLAALVALLNQQREDHIITVEDPIEVVQAAQGCNITQREVGRHTRTFFSALKGALREDPDVIVIGELRDLETIEMAITAAETGHLVIGTMHTSDAATTLNRLLDVFPPAQQTQIRASVAESLRGIVCQKLLPADDGGVVLACEILVGNTAVGNLIRENKPQGLRNVMETGIREGMCLMENVIFDLYQEGKITRQTALAQIVNRVLRGKIT
ncbi:MAG: PilT/PilU family type 4a pilus ATPase [Opitutaceae bacterium]